MSDQDHIRVRSKSGLVRSRMTRLGKYQDRSGQFRSCQGKVKTRSCLDHIKFRIGQIRPDQVRSDQDKIKIRSGQDRTGYVRSVQVRTDPVKVS